MTALVAVVTGASRGIGRHLADAFTEAGYAVERGSSASTDVTDRAAVDEWVDAVLTRRGRVDALVNNAGVIDAEVPLEESDPDEWWRVMEVNVLGPYLMTRAILPHMITAGRGRIINVSSGAALRPGAVASAYNASKTALARLTGATHLSGLAHGVQAFDLAPGVVRTDMTVGTLMHRGRTEWTDPSTVGELALALAGGELDAWSGRLVRAGVDTPGSLRRRAEAGLQDLDRTIGLVPWGADDPLG